MIDPTRQHLEQVRHAVLGLHKALLDSERGTYEQTVGRIQSPNHFLQLLTRDPWFAWLQPLSQLIVMMDEAMDNEDPLTMVRVQALVKQTKLLLVASESGDGFARHYFEALQRDPEVVLAHGDLMKVVGPAKHRRHPKD